MKKSQRKLALLGLALMAVGNTALAYDHEADGIYYNLVNDSCAVVTYGKSTSNSYADTVRIPAVIGVNEAKYTVTGIGRQAFYNCTKLAAVTLPETLREIDSWAFGKCSSLTEIVIPDSVTSIGDFVFEGCTALKYVNINTPFVSSWFAGLEKLEKIVFGNEVNDIETGAFQGCTGLVSVTINTPILSTWFSNSTSLQEIILGDKVVKVEKAAIPTTTKIYTQAGGKTLLAVWSAGYKEPLETGVGEVLAPTSLTFVSSTQSTASFKVNNIYPDYTISYNGKTLRGSQITLSNLKPDSEGEASVDVALDDVVYQPMATYKTQGIKPFLKDSIISPTSFCVVGTYEKGDANITGQRIEANSQTKDSGEALFTGLDPLTTYKVRYIIEVSYGEDSVQQADYRDSLWITTGQLKLTTLEPKVISAGEVIVAAQSNIENDVEKVGFEWRRTDAPATVSSKSGEAFLFEGTMEGILHNLTSSNYWNYRPYYESASAKKYYGEWGTVEADDYSYFEPTVHTYASINIKDDRVEVNGYAMRGTDEVTEQGFAYWEEDTTVVEESRVYGGFKAKKASAIPSNVKKVMATGQVMKAELTELKPHQVYRYVAYMTTEKGETFYGEQRTFVSIGGSTGIEQVFNTGLTNGVNKVYDMNGRQLLQMKRGLNIIRTADGKIRKVVVK